MKTGLFIGSFDPFTIGHDAVVRRALPLFDRIVIGVGVNERKKYMYSSDVRVKSIAELYAAEFAHREGAWFIIKGVRSIKDFQYEREQADINRQIGGIDTILFYAEPRMESISSTMIRELIHFGKDVSEFLPMKK